MSATVSDVRAVLARARDSLGGSGRRTILFLDEIHRFNKAQQDALLPAVEEALVTLIGATTENPYFEVNSALLSRCQIYELEPLSEEELAPDRAARSRGAGHEARRRPRRAGRSSCRRRRAQRAQHPRARRPDGARRGDGRSPRSTWRTPPASDRSSTTRAATRITTSFRRSSSRCAAPTRTRRCTTWPRCWRAARTPVSSRGG